MKNMLALAISIASQAFEERVDRQGKPYILHCLRVMQSVQNLGDEEIMCIAVLHDLIEDCMEWTIEDLTRLGFSIRVLNALELLTHKPEIHYDAYIREISNNQDARMVKLADLKDNSDVTRCKGLTKADFVRLEKYHKAYVYLSKV